MKERINKISSHIRNNLAIVIDKQEKKQYCGDYKHRLDINIREFVKIHKQLKHSPRAIERMIKRQFGIEFGNKNKPYVKPVKSLNDFNTCAPVGKISMDFTSCSSVRNAETN